MTLFKVLRCKISTPVCTPNLIGVDFCFAQFLHTMWKRKVLQHEPKIIYTKYRQFNKKEYKQRH